MNNYKQRNKKNGKKCDSLNLMKFKILDKKEAEFCTTSSDVFL